MLCQWWETKIYLFYSRLEPDYTHGARNMPWPWKRIRYHPIFNAIFSFYPSFISFDANSSDFKTCFEPTFWFRKVPHDPDPDRKLKRLCFTLAPISWEEIYLEIGIKALNQVCKERFSRKLGTLFIGDKIDPIRLADGKVIKMHHGWNWRLCETIMKYRYCCILMLSPHPSYLPLQAASCGALTITNSYGVKNSWNITKHI